jgi:hypothetical protein
VSFLFPKPAKRSLVIFLTLILVRSPKIVCPTDTQYPLTYRLKLMEEGFSDGKSDVVDEPLRNHGNPECQHELNLEMGEALKWIQPVYNKTRDPYLLQLLGLVEQYMTTSTLYRYSRGGKQTF